MAIGYQEVRIVSAGRGESLVGLQFYVCRQDGKNPVDGRTYRFSKDAADLASYDVLLPPGAPLAFHDPTKFCAALELRETTIDRKTGLPRFKTGAQTGKHVVLALPKELSLKEQRRLACAWARSQYVNHGVGAIVAVHHPDDPATGNAHAHVLVGTRLITSAGLGAKARKLNPRFSRGANHDRATLHAEDLPGRWAAFQDDWFQKAGIELRVDPFQRRGGTHLGRARFVPDSDAAAADLAAFEDSKKRIQDPAEALAELTRRKAMFSRREIAALFRRYKFAKDEVERLTRLVLAHPDLVTLHDPEKGEPLRLFTTRQVRAQERSILEAAKVLLGAYPEDSRRRKIAAAARKRMATMGLTPEQAEALRYLTTGPNLRVLRGIAGAGKSYTVKSVREALEAGGYRVVGLAPTNTVSSAMAVDGFVEASTVDLELIRQEGARPGTEPWDNDTCLIIDEAAMLDAGRYERILVRAAAAGARVILVGDEKQLASVERGGIFDELKARHGCVELLDVRRQNDDWAKVASQDFAAGRMREGLEAYNQRGHLHWSDDLDAAMAELVACWGEDVRRDPDASRFVYAATNVVVDRLNVELQNERWRGRHVGFESFETSRGPIDLVEGDRIQLHGNDRKLGLYNGIAGTVTHATQARISFTTDAGERLSFEPNEFKTWALGYAGTTYRGQGKTQAQVYALYDHQLAWHARTAYVGFTRHKQSMDLFVPRALAADLGALVRQTSRADQTQASIALLDDAEAATLRAKLAGQASKRQVGACVKTAAVRSEIEIAKAPPACRQPAARPLRITLAGRAITFNIAELSARAAMVKTLSDTPIEDAVAAYRKLPRTSSPPDEPIEDLKTRLATMAKERGWHIVTGRPHPDPLSNLRQNDEPLHHDATLAPQPGEPDFRPFLQSPSSFSLKQALDARKILRGFDRQPLEALRDAGWSAWAGAGMNDRLRYPVVIAMAWLQSWTWRWRERLGFDVVAPQPPGIYRRRYLSLMDKARTEFRAFDPVSSDAPSLDESSRVAPAAPQTCEPEPEQPHAMPNPPPLVAAPTLSPWELQQRAQAAKAAKRRELEARLAEITRKRLAATGEERIALTIKQAEISVALDNLERGFGLAPLSPASSAAPTQPAAGHPMPLSDARQRQPQSQSTAEAEHAEPPHVPAPSTAPRRTRGADRDENLHGGP